MPLDFLAVYVALCAEWDQTGDTLLWLQPVLRHFELAERRKQRHMARVRNEPTRLFSHQCLLAISCDSASVWKEAKELRVTYLPFERGAFELPIGVP